MSLPARSAMIWTPLPASANPQAGPEDIRPTPQRGEDVIGGGVAVEQSRYASKIPTGYGSRGRRATGVDRMRRPMRPTAAPAARVAAIWRELVHRVQVALTHEDETPACHAGEAHSSESDLGVAAGVVRRDDLIGGQRHSEPARNRTNVPGGPLPGSGTARGGRVPRRATTARRRRSGGEWPRARRLRCANVTVRAAPFAFAVLRCMILLRAMSDSCNKAVRCQCTGSGQRIPAGEARNARLGLGDSSEMVA